MMVECNSFIKKIISNVNAIEPVVDLMLNNSSIYYYDSNSDDSYIVVVGESKYHWGSKDEKTQIKAKQLYNNFYSSFKLLLWNVSPDVLYKIEQANFRIINLIEQNRAPSSIDLGKKDFREQTQVFKDFLELLNDGERSTLVIPDTNSLIQYPDPVSYQKITKTEKFIFVILPTVLSELDKLKVIHRDDDFRKKVTSVIKRLKGFRKQGYILDGVTVNKTIKVKMIATEPDFEKTLNWLDPNNNDDRIIANALELQIRKPSDEVIFVSSDLNFQNKAELANLTVYDTDDL